VANFLNLLAFGYGSDNSNLPLHAGQVSIVPLLAKCDSAA